MEVAARRPPKGLIHHSDRGSQYCSHRHQKLMKQFMMKPSMIRKGNCRDNASMESFFGSLMQETVHHREYRTRQEAMVEIREYIEVFYNRQHTGRNSSGGKGLPDHNMVSTIADRPHVRKVIIPRTARFTKKGS